jgi:hypothetical protein
LFAAPITCSVGRTCGGAEYQMVRVPADAMLKAFLCLSDFVMVE